MTLETKPLPLLLPQYFPALYLLIHLTVLHLHHLPLTITTKTTSIMDHGHQASTTSGWQLPSLAYLRERTVHTIYFKIWDPDSPSRSLYVEEINQQGTVRQFDPEHFFYKLTGDYVQANQMSDYWRSHYGLPLHHGGTPHHPTWASSTSPTTPSTIPTAAKQLATLLFGAQAAERLTAPGAPAVDTLPDINAIDSSVTNELSPDRLLHLAIFLRELSTAA